MHTQCKCVKMERKIHKTRIGRERNGDMKIKIEKYLKLLKKIKATAFYFIFCYSYFTIHCRC